MKTAVLALLAVVLAYGRPQATSARPAIVTIRPSGEVVTDWMGPNPTGILIYDRTGHMSVQLMHGPRATWPKRSADPVAVADTASLPEKVAAFNGYYGYYGRYEVSEKDHLIRHHIEGSLWPSAVGFTYERHFEFSGNRVTLTTTPFRAKGEQRYNRLIFERVE